MKRQPKDTPFGIDYMDEAYFEALEFLKRPRRHPRGGQLIDPPEDCPYKKTYDDGTTWTDLGICQTACKSPKSCKRLWDFKRMDDYEKKQELLRKGVTFGWPNKKGDD